MLGGISEGQARVGSGLLLGGLRCAEKGCAHGNGRQSGPFCCRWSESHPKRVKAALTLTARWQGAAKASLRNRGSGGEGASPTSQTLGEAPAAPRLHLSGASSPRARRARRTILLLGGRTGDFFQRKTGGSWRLTSRKRRRRRGPSSSRSRRCQSMGAPTNPGACLRAPDPFPPLQFFAAQSMLVAALPPSPRTDLPVARTTASQHAQPLTLPFTRTHFSHSAGARPPLSHTACQPPCMN